MSKKMLVKTLYLANGALLLLSSGTGVVTAATLHAQQASSAQVSSIGLADISILENTSLVSNTGTDLMPNGDGNFDLSLQFQGKGLATVGLADDKVLVYALPAELQGKVVGGASVDIQADLLPITPGQLPGVSALFSTLGTALTGLNAVLPIPSVLAAFNQLNELQDLGQYTQTVQGTVSPDGKYISVDFTQGFGNYVHQAYASLFHALRDAIAALDSSNPLIKPALDTVKGASEALFVVIDGIAAGTSDVLNSALNANLLGSMTGTLNVTVSHPGVAQQTIRAAAISNALISADILAAINSEGSAVTLNFPMDQEDPLENYNVATPSVNLAKSGDTSVSGHVDLETPIPDGTTFEASVTMPDGTIKTAVVDSNGDFTIATDALVALDELSVKVTAKNGNYTKDSLPVMITVSDDTNENPL
ncbi:adhesive domain-containing protein, partial [Companilactobacillus sp. RD055328]|uniref:adhesive domain-containing protein n=1 Tax=Companilactobacillus sp. RD055328 TaxID=2916634 RepID=UPI0035D073AF